LEHAESIKIGKKYTEIVSIGGGSTIDVGKWLARKYGLKHTAIPTTCGSGSEMTKFCVLMVDGKKVTFSDKRFIPKKHILQPNLLQTLPVDQIISSGLDALSHSLESYWSINSTKMSRKYSLSAMNFLVSNFKKALKYDEEALMYMLVGANLAGRAINITKTNVCHAISYPLTEIYGIPHGIACAMTLPYFTKKMMGKDISFIKRYLPTYKIDKKKIADIAFKSGKLKDCPKLVTKLDIKKAL